MGRRDKKDREHLAGEHPLNDLLQVILFFIFITVWIADSFWLKLTVFPANHVPFYIRVLLGVFILLLCLYLFKGFSNTVFDEKNKARGVVREGLFSRVRHPLYLSTMLFYLALTAFTFSLAALVFCFFIFLYYNFAAAYEEKLLLAKFGDEYRKYMQDVPRWLPKLFP